jgi:hypothetical protein
MTTCWPGPRFSWPAPLPDVAMNGSPAPSLFAVRGLLALGLPKVALETTQASAARLDDTYGLLGKRCRPVHFTNS